MKKTLLVIAAAGLTAGLWAYGVNPSQYTQTQGQTADPHAGHNHAQPMPGAPAPNPMTLNQVAPGGQLQINQPQIQMNQPPADFENAAVPDWAKAWKHHKWEDSKKLWESKAGLFIDARSKGEYDQGHIPGAIPMPLGEFDTYYPKYEKQIKAAKELVTYCHGVGCQLSNKVAQKLWEDKKFRNVGSFFGGWPQWQQHNMPVETGPEPKRK